MKTIVKIMLFWSIFIIISTIPLFAEERSYKRYLLDDQGKKILRLTVSYLGKEPIKPFNWHEKVEWRKGNIDFYTKEWKNLTGHKIKFIKTTSKNKLGKRRNIYRLLQDGTKEIIGAPSISTRIYADKPREDGNILGPYETQTNENYFYGISDDVTYNIVTLKTTFGYLGKEYVMSYHFVGTRK